MGEIVASGVASGRIGTPRVQPTGLGALAARGRGGWATLGASEPVEVPLPDEGEREQVWRPGFGWVSRPVEVPAESEKVAA